MKAPGFAGGWLLVNQLKYSSEPKFESENPYERLSFNYIIQEATVLKKQRKSMKISPRDYALCTSVLALAFLGGCNTENPGSTVAIANPASEHCVKKGGKLEIVKEAAGEKGMCHLPDGSVVEEWELFRRDNPQK